MTTDVHGDHERELRQLLARIVMVDLVLLFLLVLAVTIGPWEITEASVALIGLFAQPGSIALGGLLIPSR